MSDVSSDSDSSSDHSSGEDNAHFFSDFNPRANVPAGLLDEREAVGDGGDSDDDDDDEFERAVRAVERRVDLALRQRDDARGLGRCSSSARGDALPPEAKMPPSVLEMALPFLDAAGLVAVSQVNREWRQVARSNDWLWKRLYTQRWPTTQHALVSSLVASLLNTSSRVKRKGSEGAEEGKRKHRRLSRGKAQGKGEGEGEGESEEAGDGEIEATGKQAHATPWAGWYGRRHLAEDNFLHGKLKLNRVFAHNGAVCGVRSFRNCIVSGGQDKLVKVWDRNHLCGGSGFPQPFQLEGHREAVWGVDMSDQCIASASGDCTVGIWRSPMWEEGNVQQQRRPLRLLQGHSAEVWAVALFENRLLSASVDGYVKLWDLETCKLVQTITHITAGAVHSSLPSKMDMCASVFDCVLGATSALTAGGDCRILEWDLRAITRPVREFKGHDESVFSLACQHGVLASASGDATVRVWDRGSGRTLHVLPHPNAVWACATDGNRRLVTGGVDSRLRLVDVDGACASVVDSVVCHAGAVFACDLDDTTVVTGGADGDLVCLDLVVQ